MRLCVGAVTRRVIEEAAKLHVPEIIASRRQVDIGGGYTGLDQEQLVHLVDGLSGGATSVVRDHGGPYQNGDPADDWCRSLDADVKAGFHKLHLDVCKIDGGQQEEVLADLLKRYAGELGMQVEVGGERDSRTRLDSLLHVASQIGLMDYVTHAVIDLGGHIWNDRQCGILMNPGEVKRLTDRYHDLGVDSKAHNMDWAGMRSRYEGAVDAINIAPEFASVETDAWLMVMSYTDAAVLLEFAYASRAWERWFTGNEGTRFDRAKCAVRYVMERPEVVELLKKYESHEDFVRGRIRDAIIHWA